MACTIQRNREGKITSVETLNGMESQLFKEINSNAFMADTEISLSAYMNSHSKAVKDADLVMMETGEPKLHYRTPDNKIHDSLEKAIISNSKGKIRAGFLNQAENSLMDIFSFNTLASKESIFIADKIQEGLLSAERVLGRDGVNRFQAKGNFLNTKELNAIILKDRWKAELANPNVIINRKGEIEIDQTEDFTTVEWSNGNKEVIHKSMIGEYLEKDGIDNKVELFVSNFIDNLVEDTIEKSDEGVNIRESLMRFLGDMGFTTTTLDKYSENYRTKHNEDPDIDALADIANKVVAFSRGEISMDSLSEEVAHIAIELYNDQNSIVEAMANVVLTPEYAEHAEYYRQKYSEKHEGQQLEEMVRKEVLGKILKKQLQSNFETESAVRGPLKRIWDSIVEYFSQRIKPYHQRQIDQLNSRIADSIFESRTEDFQGVPGTGAIFYNAQPKKYQKIQTELEAQKKHYEHLFRNALSQPVPNRAEMENIINLINDVDIVSTAATMVGIADAQSKVLANAIERGRTTGEAIKTKDETAYNILKNNLVPSMHAVGNILERELDGMKSDRMKNQSKQILETLKTIDNRMNKLQPEMGANKTRIVQEELEDSLKRSTLTEEDKQEARDQVFGGIKDNTQAGAKFGLASHSKNVLIQLLYKLGVRVNSNTRARFNRLYNEIVGEVQADGIMKYQKDLLYKVDGKDTFYMLSPRDYHQDEVAIKAEEVRIIAEKTKLKEEVVKEAMKKHTIEEIIMDKLGEKNGPAELQDFFNKRADYRTSLKERPRTEEYYKQAQARFDKANVDDATIRYMRTKNVAKGQRDQNFLDAYGNLDNSLKTKEDLQQDWAEKKEYNEAKAPIDANGHLKEGLIVKEYKDLTEADKKLIPPDVLEIMGELDFVGDVTLPEYDIDALSIESRRALDLQNLNFVYRSEIGNNEKGTASNEYNAKITELDKTDRAYEWVMANSSVHFSSEYYESLGEGLNYYDIVENYIDGLADGVEKEDKILTLERVKDLQRSRRNVLKQNRRPGSAVETNVHTMTDLTRATIKQLDQEIADAKMDMRLPAEIRDRLSEIEFKGESALNEDFWAMKEEAGGTIYDFALSHMTEANKLDSQNFARQAEDYILGRRYTIDRKYERFIEEYGEEVGTVDNKVRIQNLKDKYAQTKVASYYKRFQPEGYNELIEAMKNGDLKMRDAIDKTDLALYKYPALEYLEITPDYVWQNEVSGEGMRNPNFNKRGLRDQPKALNEQFFEFFGVKKEDYLALDDEDISLLVPTKNKEAFALLIKITETHKKIHELYKIDGNPYELQQISNDKMEKLFDLKNVKENTVDLITDVFRSKEDEIEYGEELSNGTNIRTIPKYYQNRLENPEIVSKNLMTSAMLSLKEAIRYDERVKSEDKINAVEYQIGQQKLEKMWGSKSKNRITGEGQVSNTHKRAQEIVDNMLYGIRQSRKIVVDIYGKEIDLTQVFTTLTKYSTVLNLAVSPIIEATSFTTGLYNNVIDSFVEEYYSRESGTWASKKIGKMIYEYYQEAGSFTKESDLSHLMEFVGIVDAEDKINQSLRSLPARMIDKSYFAMAKLANMPITPRNMLAVMKDYKWYPAEGRFISKNDFIRIMKTENKASSKSATNQAWSKLTDSFFDNIIIDKKKGVMMGEKFAEKYQTRGEALQAFEDYRVDLTSKIQVINQNVDSVMSEEDQVLAKRDFAFNAFLQHRSFFIINMTKAFKGKMVNLSTGQVEQGHFKGLISLAAKLVKNKAQGKDFLYQMEEQEMRNLKRLKVSTITFAILAAMVHGIDMEDDDDDLLALQFAQLIGLRSVAESMSVMPLGLGGETIGMYKNPIPQTGMIENFYNGAKALATGDMDKFYDKIGKNILFTRRYNQFSKMDHQVSSYRHFNDETLWMVGLGK